MIDALIGLRVSTLLVAARTEEHSKVCTVCNPGQECDRGKELFKILKELEKLVDAAKQALQKRVEEKIARTPTVG